MRNDGTPESGQEIRSSDVLESYLAGSGLELERFEPTPGRRASWPASRDGGRMHPRCC